MPQPSTQSHFFLDIRRIYVLLVRANNKFLLQSTRVRPGSLSSIDGMNSIGIKSPSVR